MTAKVKNNGNTISADMWSGNTSITRRARWGPTSPWKLFQLNRQPRLEILARNTRNFTHNRRHRTVMCPGQMLGRRCLDPCLSSNVIKPTWRWTGFDNQGPSVENKMFTGWLLLRAVIRLPSFFLQIHKYCVFSERYGYIKLTWRMTL